MALKEGKKKKNKNMIKRKTEKIEFLFYIRWSNKFNYKNTNTRIKYKLIKDKYKNIFYEKYWDGAVFKVRNAEVIEAGAIEKDIGKYIKHV